jgi:hypothetical protein
LHLVVTSQTADRIWRHLKQSNLRVHCSSHHYQALYRDALQVACAPDVDRVVHCDFDRLLHWLATYPQELRGILDGPQLRAHDYLQCGRTPRAFRSHPSTQTRTEGLLNATLSRLLDLDPPRDFYASCFAAAPPIIARLATLPAWNRYGFYATWPFVAWRTAANPGYLEAEGLEWETPDRYQAEIHAEGYEAWLTRVQTTAEWVRRVRVVEDGVWALLHHVQ